MATAQTNVGSIQHVAGQVFARTINGTERQLDIGDNVQLGEQIITEQNGVIHIDLVTGSELILRNGEAVNLAQLFKDQGLNIEAEPDVEFIAELAEVLPESEVGDEGSDDNPREGNSNPDIQNLQQLEGGVQTQSRNTGGAIQTASFEDEQGAVVDVQASTPILVVENVSGAEDTPILLSISSELSDNDGSETVTYVLSEIPVGSVLSDGINTAVVTDGDQDISGWDLSAITLQPPLHLDQSFSLTLTATSSEANIPNTTTSTVTFDVNITPVNDAAEFSGDISGVVFEDGEPLRGNLNHTDVDSNNSDDVFLEILEPQPSQNGYGSFIISADGIWEFTLDNSLPQIQALNNGGELTDSFVVTAEDGTQQVIQVQINGTNDAPLLLTLSDSSVQEEQSGAVVGTLSASDPDDGDTQTYTVSDARFEVVNNELRLKAGESLDHETESSIEITVTVTDSGGLTDTENFTLEVTDVNEAPSNIQLDNLSVSENAAGAVVGTLSASDPDDGDTQSYTVSDARFEVVNNELRLKAGESLDHETESSIDITVTVTDSGGLTDTENFTLEVTDVNEAPSNIQLDNLSISENAAGAVVGTLSATDQDDSDTQTYTVSDARFEVVNNELRLKAGESLDHETESSIDITVTVTDSGGLTDTENFTLEVTDVNEAPSNIQLDNLSISENAAGAVVGTLSATDPDDSDTQSYTVSDARFEVVNNELRLKAGESLDHETESSIEITVTVTDSGGLTDTENFTLEVTDVNETPSNIQLDNLSVSENAAGAVVGTLSASDPDDSDTQTYTVSDARFEVVNNELRLKAGESLDHETESSIDITVTVTDSGGLTDTENFTLEVTDVNEAPSNIQLDNLSISENAAGAVVGTLSATDPDDSDTQSYTVSDVRFEVVNNELRLKAGESLDHETESSIEITVTVTDSEGLSDTENFTLEVTDVNETPSNIQLDNLSVSENAAGAVVGTLSATDPDDSDTQSYTVSDARFEVVNNELRLKAGESLDHETESSIDITVTVTDSDGLSDTENFTLEVTDVNEAPSNIQLDNLSVSENAAGAVVGTLSASDPDDGDTQSYTVSDARFEVVNNELRLKAGESLDHETESSIEITVTVTDSEGLSDTENFTLEVTDVNETPSNIQLDNLSVSENAAGAVVGALSATDPDDSDTQSYTVSDARFEVVNNELRLKAGESLDHETESSIDITVTVTDSDGLSDTENFTLEVTDVNEAPSNIQLDNLSVSENAAGAVVGTLSASDPDDGDTQSYTVSDARFEVVNNELRLKAGESLDHETESSIEITVTVTDSEGLSDTENFTLEVTDVNETPSNIQLDNLSVSENAAGAVVGTLSATDPDDGDTQSYTVSDARFEVVNNELRLKAGESLDHETESSIEITVTVTDSGGLTDTENFTLEVTDVNEAPSNIQLDNLSVSENAAGAVVGTLSASDPDDGDTQSYTVSDARFEVVNNELRLKAGESLDHETESSIEIAVTVTDSGGLTDTENFTLEVTDVNEVPSNIQLDNLSVSENAAGAVVGTLSASDPDDGDTQSYTVSDARFEVVNNELRLKAGESLDHETESSIEITVTVTDSGGLTDTENFTLEVTDVNEAPSNIQLDNLSVSENAAGAVVGTLSASDPDDGDTQSYTVSDARFEVVNNELRLKAGESLDHETESSIDITVTVTDSGGLTDTENFILEVTDVNEAPSNIQLDNLSVSENAAGAVVGTLSATDPDDGDTQTYTVSDARFEVVNNELRLKAGESLDHETESSIEITVTVTDSGGLTDTENFTLEVTDVNEAPSNIQLDNLSVSENAAGAVVGTLSASDPDDGDTQSYTVSDARFEVVNNELRLKAGESLDHETESSIDITVTVTDSGGLTDTENFTLEVIDVNEAPSNIQLDNLSVSENAAGAVVGTLSASDPDDGDTQTYTVSDARFEVVNNELRLKAGESLDHETESSIEITVTVTDSEGLSDTENFTLEVTDVNEAPSNIQLDNLSVSENAAGAVVGTLSATDPDDGDTQTYTVSDARFEVVNNELRLKAGESLDHETESSIDITVTVTDSDGLSDTENFTLEVTDVNEAPSNIQLDNLSVSENAAGAVVGTLSASDPDDGDTQSYTVSDARFEVVNNELRLKAGESLDHETESSIEITVTVTDSGGLTDTENFTLEVTDVNEDPVANDDYSTAVIFSESFENHNISGNNWAVYQDYSGWEVNSAGIEIQHGSAGGSVASEGNSHVELDTNPTAWNKDGSTLSSISKEIATPEEQYTLLFDYKPRPSAKADSEMLVIFGDISFTVVSDADGNVSVVDVLGGVIPEITQSESGWYTISVVANTENQDTSTLSFSGGGESNTVGAYLDNIVVLGDAPYEVTEGESITINPDDLLANDTDVDSFNLTLTSVEGVNGIAFINAGGDIIFTPDEDYHGAASIRYTVSDGDGGSDVANVHINVLPVNDPPVGRDFTVSPTNTADTDVAINFNGMISDIEDGEVASVIIKTLPQHGTLYYQDGVNKVEISLGDEVNRDALIYEPDTTSAILGNVQQEDDIRQWGDQVPGTDGKSRSSLLTNGVEVTVTSSDGRLKVYDNDKSHIGYGLADNDGDGINPGEEMIFDFDGAAVTSVTVALDGLGGRFDESNYARATWKAYGVDGNELAEGEVINDKNNSLNGEGLTEVFIIDSQLTDGVAISKLVFSVVSGHQGASYEIRYLEVNSYQEDMFSYVPVDSNGAEGGEHSIRVDWNSSDLITSQAPGTSHFVYTAETLLSDNTVAEHVISGFGVGNVAGDYEADVLDFSQLVDVDDVADIGQYLSISITDETGDGREDTVVSYDPDGNGGQLDVIISGLSAEDWGEDVASGEDVLIQMINNGQIIV